jgi:hypothetical protein
MDIASVLYSLVKTLCSFSILYATRLSRAVYVYMKYLARYLYQPASHRRRLCPHAGLVIKVSRVFRRNNGRCCCSPRFDLSFHARSRRGIPRKLLRGRGLDILAIDRTWPTLTRNWRTNLVVTWHGSVLLLAIFITYWSKNSTHLNDEAGVGAKPSSMWSRLVQIAR